MLAAFAYLLTIFFSSSLSSVDDFFMEWKIEE